MAHQGHDFLPNLTAAFVSLEDKPDLLTQEFTDACGSVLPIFNSLGALPRRSNGGPGETARSGAPPGTFSLHCFHRNHMIRLLFAGSVFLLAKSEFSSKVRRGRAMLAGWG